MEAAGPEADFRIIALVSSAGGLRAISEVLSQLPADFPAAVLVLQHAEPTRVSQLPDILSSRTEMQVELATDGQVLRPGQVLVCPSGWHTLISPDATVHLIVSGAYPPSRPSADLLLTTLALSAGRRVVGVVLTGGGVDAATGATAVHKFGGVVIASDEASSEVFSMPEATIGRDSAIDSVVPLKNIGALLLDLVNAPTIGDVTTLLDEAAPAGGLDPPTTPL